MNDKIDAEKKELKKYYNFNLSMLQLMGLLAVIGIVVTAILYFLL